MLVRREVLALAGRGVVAASLGGLLACRTAESGAPEPTLPGADPATVAALVAIGDAYLEGRPEDRDATSLAATLGLEPDTMTLDEAQAIIRSGATADYSTGRVVEVDGWVLSQTEARVAALVALGPAG